MQVKTNNLTRPGFSLVELMISIALALIILLGVNYVFRQTQQTVSTGLALSQQTRTQAAVSDTIRKDLASPVPAARQPALVIHSYGVWAFQDANDQRTDPDTQVMTADLLGNGSEQKLTMNNPGLPPPPSPNKRFHRVDTLSFFASGVFHRQTGQPMPIGSPVLVSDVTSADAWIWYGHVAQPDQSGNFYGPGEPATATPPEYIANPSQYRNAYASNWILGRVATLLVEPDAQTGQITDSAGTQQVFNWYNSTNYSNYGSVSAAGAADPLGPLEYGAQSCTVIPTAANSNTGSWGTQQIQTSYYDMSGTSTAHLFTAMEAASRNSTLPTYWWYPLIYQLSLPPTSVPSPLPYCYRYHVNTTPTMSPNQSPWAMAQTTPALLSGCTQFIVEYAGDFATQDNAGNYVNTTPDGQVDYYYDPTTGTRQIQWYGYPRFDGKINVAPLARLSGTKFAFEKEVPPIGSATPYTCVWTPADPKPSMIRLTVMTVDPQGRLGEPSIQQYIMKLQ